MDSLISRSDRQSAVLLIVLCLWLAGCASAPPTPDVDFNPEIDFTGITRAAMYRDSGQVTGENPLQLSDMARDRIDLALQRALAQKGITFTDDPSQADVLLSWHLVNSTSACDG